MLADPEVAEAPPAPPSEAAEVPPTPPSRLLAVAAATPPTARTDVVVATAVAGICVFMFDGVTMVYTQRNWREVNVKTKCISFR